MARIDLGVCGAPARLPAETAGRMATVGVVSALAHAIAVAAIVGVAAHAPRGAAPVENDRAAIADAPLPRLVFLAPRQPSGGGGGGGGGNRRPAPIRHAESRGRDRATLPATRHVSTAASPTPITTPTSALIWPVDTAPPAVLLDARPLASGDAVHVGLPVGGVPFGTSQGPGSGGGVGSGSGTGIGSGVGPGVGAGSGGGTGGGVYHVGGSVSAPRLLVRVDPRYTPDALQRRVEGSVTLNLVVTRTGMPTDIRVVRSLAADLDDEAVKALMQWRFAPGRLAGSPVDVQVVVVMDFWVH